MTLSRNQRDAVTSRLRLRDYDYRTPGMYFVTVCIENRAKLLGRVVDLTMHNSDAGSMVDTWIERLADRFPTVTVDGHVIMPNHIHCIFTLHATKDGNIPDDGPSLTDVVHWLKTRSTVAYGDGVKQLGWPRYDGSLWQSGFMDHIIRSESALERLQEYIESNPALWPQDELNQGMPERR